jgi:hypothetical protein
MLRHQKEVFAKNDRSGLAGDKATRKNTEKRGPSMRHRATRRLAFATESALKSLADQTNQQDSWSFNPTRIIHA